MKTIISLSTTLIIANSFSYSQQKSVLIIDPFTGYQDSITNIYVDTTLTQDKSTFFVGTSTNGIANLDLQIPTNNVFSGSNFTMNSPTSNLYAVNKFPVSSSVRLSHLIDGIVNPWCSGSMISRKHVLTSAHCVSSPFPLNDSLIIDSILISPAFDNGIEHTQYGTSLVTKVYLFRNWEVGVDDFAVLELDQDLGSSTGWISVGFNEDNIDLLQNHYYKFSYPNYLPYNYNGDTLYTNHGLMNEAFFGFLGVTGAEGVNAQSGSSLIHIENGLNYTSYGTATYSAHFRHSKIQNWQFFSILKIIENDTTLLTHNHDEIKCLIFPNPTSGHLFFKTEVPIKKITLSSLSGQVLHLESSANELNISKFEPGVYIAHILFEDGRESSYRIVKT